MLHTHGRGGKGQPRVLYYFRTPPNVRVGRSPIDEDAIRLLEESNPDVEFDWTRILRQTPPPAQEPKREGRREKRREGRGQHVERRAKGQPPAPTPARAERIEAGQVAAERIPAEQIEADQIEADQIEADQIEADEIEADEIEADEIEAEQLSSEDIEPIEPISGDEPAVVAAPEVMADEVRSPTLERLGAEGLARLRARYAEVLARIAERQLDEAAREQLKLQAERLNPDVWVTAAEVTEGLEQYETVYESLRAVVGAGHRRRRRRR